MKRLGINDNEIGREILKQHFQEVVGMDGNILQNFSNQHGIFEVRESLLFGPSGKAARLKTTFEVREDGARRFITTITSGVK